MCDKTNNLSIKTVEEQADKRDISGKLETDNKLFPIPTRSNRTGQLGFFCHYHSLENLTHLQTL